MSILYILSMPQVIEQSLFLLIKGGGGWRLSFAFKGHVF